MFLLDVQFKIDKAGSGSSHLKLGRHQSNQFMSTLKFIAYL